jgi:hypothetical protein
MCVFGMRGGGRWSNVRSWDRGWIFGGMMFCRVCVLYMCIYDIRVRNATATEYNPTRDSSFATPYRTIPACTTNPLPSLNPSPNKASGTCHTRNFAWKLFNHASNTSGLLNCCAIKQSVGVSPSARKRHRAAHVLFNGSMSDSLYMQSHAITKSTAGDCDTSSVSQSRLSVRILSTLTLAFDIFLTFFGLGNTVSMLSAMFWRSSLRT